MKLLAVLVLVFWQVTDPYFAALLAFGGIPIWLTCWEDGLIQGLTGPAPTHP